MQTLPESDTDYLFDLADSAPDRPSEISGPDTVMKYFGNLVSDQAEFDFTMPNR